ncbi:hypothetical protein BSKO_04342 [Bryopsis sp. KO-2023]|nr:hypothetical protein BSKO_04342 [Bryopsis sp. KO-2023]
MKILTAISSRKPFYSAAEFEEEARETEKRLVRLSTFSRSKSGRAGCPSTAPQPSLTASLRSTDLERRTLKTSESRRSPYLSGSIRRRDSTVHRSASRVSHAASEL